MINEYIYIIRRSTVRSKDSKQPSVSAELRSVFAERGLRSCETKIIANQNTRVAQINHQYCHVQLLPLNG